MKKILLHLTIILILAFPIITKSDEMNMISPITSEDGFKNYIKSKSITLKEANTNDLISLMIQFYIEKRAIGCDLKDQGDMLLYQWGAYSFTDEHTFTIDITRQFILIGTEGDDGMSQLSLSLHYPLTEELKKIELGDKWCETPQDINELNDFIKNNIPFKILKDYHPTSIELWWNEI